VTTRPNYRERPLDSNNGSVTAAVPQLWLAGPSTRPRVLLAELWAARELCVTLARQSFFVRYRRAVFGMTWAVVVPIFQAVVLSQILGRVARFQVPHYATYVFSGIAAWSYFTSTVVSASTAIVDNSSLSSRIYFPRCILPISTALSNVFTLGATVIVLFILASSEGAFGWKILALVPAAVLCVLFTTTLGLVLSALHVYFRDVRYAVAAAMMLLFYLTPVFYPLTRLHGLIRDIVVLNPLTGIVQLFHWSVAATPTVVGPLCLTFAWLAALIALGIGLHSRLDRSFADLM
jgi:ABC-type polysaccharide/polyol phosphate export permease